MSQPKTLRSQAAVSAGDIQRRYVIWAATRRAAQMPIALDKFLSINCGEQIARMTYDESKAVRALLESEDTEAMIMKYMKLNQL